MLNSKSVLVILFIASTHSKVEQKIDIDSMSGDEIAAMAIESRQNNPKESFGASFNYGLGNGPDPLEGMDLPDEIRKEIEKVVHDTMKKILIKAKDSKALRNVIREELKGHAIKDGVDPKELFGDFGWDIQGDEDENEVEQDENNEFNDNSYFEDEFHIDNDVNKNNGENDENISQKDKEEFDEIISEEYNKIKKVKRKKIKKDEL